MAIFAATYDNGYRGEHVYRGQPSEFDRLIKSVALLILFPVLFPLYVMDLVIRQFIFISIACASASGLAFSLAVAPINPLIGAATSIVFVGSFFFALKAFENGTLLSRAFPSYFNWLD